jgi:polar amino acid transport system substrate-binding protein
MPDKFNSSRWSILICLLASMLLLVGCEASRLHTVQTVETPPDQNVLRVGVTSNAQPLVFRQGNKIVGLEADFARELAEYLGKSLQFIEYDWEDLIPGLMANKIDIIMAGMTKTPLREVRITFCIPYLESGQMALIRRKDTARFSTGIFTLTTSSGIGVIKNTFGEYFVDEQYSSVKKITYSKSQKAVEDLIDKRIDMFIYDGPIILYLASTYETRGLTALFSPLTKEWLAWAVRKDNIELLESANIFLKTINKDGRYKKLIKHWIPTAK